MCCRRDVFSLLFSNVGSSVCRRPGRMFNRSDFSDNFFRNGDFLSNVCVDFPVSCLNV